MESNQIESSESFQTATIKISCIYWQRGGGEAYLQGFQEGCGVRGCHYTVQIFEVVSSAICKHILHECKAECESELRIANYEFVIN